MLHFTKDMVVFVFHNLNISIQISRKSFVLYTNDVCIKYCAEIEIVIRCTYSILFNAKSHMKCHTFFSAELLNGLVASSGKRFVKYIHT